jgi:hypothetical protein
MWYRPALRVPINTTKPALDKIEQVQIPWEANLNALETILARLVILGDIKRYTDIM